MKLAFWCCQVAFLSFAAAFMAALLSAAPAHAQKRTTHAGEGPERIPLEADWHEKPEEEKLFQSLRKGDQAITPEMETVIDHGAQWYAYRLTFIEFQDFTGGKTMHTLVKEALEQIADPNDPNQNLNALKKAFIEEFNKRFALRLREVIKNPKPIARVNAAIILARLARTGEEEAADVLADVIQDPKENDGVKLWACRGLKDIFALTRGENPIRFKNRDGERRWAQALLDYVNRHVELPSTASPNERAAIPYVRTEAIAALGQTRFPAVLNVVKKKTEVTRPTALVLLRIIRKDGITPTPTLTEQVAAVVALCQLQAKLCEDYQPDYAAYQIGKFLVEVATLYNEGKERETWRFHTARLQQALEEFKADMQGPPSNDASAYVTKFVQAAEPLLKEMSSDVKGAPDPNGLNTWLEQNPPKHASLYKSLPESTIREAEKKTETK
jgi:hypothetical protein